MLVWPGHRSTQIGKIRVLEVENQLCARARFGRTAGGTPPRALIFASLRRSSANLAKAALFGSCKVGGRHWILRASGETRPKKRPAEGCLFRS